MPSMAARFDGTRPRIVRTWSRASRVLWSRRRRSAKAPLGVRGSSRSACRRCSSASFHLPRLISAIASARSEIRPARREPSGPSRTPGALGQDPRRRVDGTWRAIDIHPPAPARGRCTSRPPVALAPPVQATERSCCTAATTWRIAFPGGREGRIEGHRLLVERGAPVEGSPGRCGSPAAEVSSPLR